MIRAVILDLDDTLYAYEPLDAEARILVQAYACKKLSVTAQRYEEAFETARSAVKLRLGDVGASHNRMLYFQETLEILGVNPVPMSLELYERYWGTFLHKMRLYDGAREFLDRMRERGVQLMICTDLTAQIQHRKIETLGIAGDISCLVTSEEAGREKPSPEIFRLCLDKLGLEPQEVCCIGDSLKRDVDGACAAGMHAILFRPDQPSAPQYARMAEMMETY